MPRFDDLTTLWNWLPAFRAAAETEHLPTAAGVLGVTPPAVSRTLRQLEKAIGQPLFRRVGRRIQLNEAGEKLLSSVRTGMRSIHSGVTSLVGPSFTRGLQVAGSGVSTLSCVLPMLLALRTRHGEIVSHIESVAPDDMASALLRGDIDLVVHSEVLNHDELESVRVGEVTNGLYCSPTHELATAKQVDLRSLAAYAFASPPADGRGNTTEGWPNDIPRRVVLRAAQMHVGAQACKTGGLLVVLPDPIGRLHALHRIPTEPLASIPVFAAHRSQPGRDFGIIIRLLGEALEEAGGRTSCETGPGA